MFANLFDGPHIILILAIVLLLFGATRLPALAKAIGQSTRIFKNEVKTNKAGTDDVDAETTDASDTVVASKAEAPKVKK